MVELEVDFELVYDMFQVPIDLGELVRKHVKFGAIETQNLYLP